MGHDQAGRDQRLICELFENAPDGVFIAGADGRYVDVNAAGCRLLGYTRDELIGRPVTETLAPEDLARQAELARHARAGAVELTEWRLRRKDGTFVEVEMSSDATPDGHLRGFVRDIGARRDTERRLRQSEAIYAGIIAVAADAIIAVDDRHHITLFNQGAEQIFGYRRDEVIGAPLDLLLPERFRAGHRGHVDGFAGGATGARGMGTRPRAIWGRRKNGEEFPADAAISKIEVDGTALLTVAVRDMSERQRVEDELRVLAEIGQILVAAGADYERILTDVATLVVGELADWCAIDLVLGDAIRRLAMVHADPAKQATAEALSRCSIDRTTSTLLGQALDTRRAVLAPDVSDAHLQAVAQSPEHLDLLRALDTGSVIVVPLIARDRVLGTIAVGRSRSARRYREHDRVLLELLAARIALAADNARLHVALERAVRARDDVLGVVAHDLRGPLNALVLEAELVRRRKADLEGERARAFAGGVVRTARRMSRLIQDLLDVTRTEAGGLAVACSAVAPAALLAEVVSSQHALADEAGVELRVEAASHLPDAWGDATRLLQVFDNLIGNAIKFTPAGGTITVSAEAADGALRFRVEDTGAGIRAEDLPHVFDRFWQASRGHGGGAGLGLAIVKSIIDAHRGEISVTSTPGRRTTFSFSIPRAPTTPA